MPGPGRPPRQLRDLVTSPERRLALEQAGHWDGETLVGRVAAHAAERPGDIAIVDLDGARQSTFADLERDSNRVARRLLELGVEPGDVVSVQLPNWYETVAIDLGVLKVGAVLNPLLPIYRARELGFMLGKAEVSVLFTPDEYRDFYYPAMVAAVRSATGRPQHHVPVPGPTSSDAGFSDWLGGVSADPVGAESVAGDVSELIFTSGTEAEPKAIMHTEQTTNFGARNLAETLGFGAEEVVWTPSPIGHSTGLNYGVRIAAYHGLKLVLQDRWSPAVAAQLISQHRCSYTVAATTFVSDLIEEARAGGADVSSLRRFGCGGAPVPPEAVRAAEDLGMSVLRMYGSTEGLAVSWNRPEAPAERRERTDGQLMNQVEVEVRDEAGMALRGEPGEIFLRSPCASVGFFADPARTDATWDKAGWIRSGDLGILDDDDCLAIVGRRKEIIIRGGLNIAPREIEDVLLGHEEILDVAVIGVPDPRLGELTCACVVLREGAELTLNGVVDFARASGMATFKLPQRLEIVAELPKTATGKVQKQRLREALIGAPDEPGRETGA